MSSMVARHVDREERRDVRRREGAAHHRGGGVLAHAADRGAGRPIAPSSRGTRAGSRRRGPSAPVRCAYCSTSARVMIPVTPDASTSARSMPSCFARARTGGVERGRSRGRSMTVSRLDRVVRCGLEDGGVGGRTPGRRRPRADAAGARSSAVRRRSRRDWAAPSPGCASAVDRGGSLRLARALELEGDRATSPPRRLAGGGVQRADDARVRRRAARRRPWRSRPRRWSG